MSNVYSNNKWWKSWVGRILRYVRPPNRSKCPVLAWPGAGQEGFECVTWRRWRECATHGYNLWSKAKGSPSPCLSHQKSKGLSDIDVDKEEEEEEDDEEEEDEDDNDDDDDDDDDGASRGIDEAMVDYMEALEVSRKKKEEKSVLDNGNEESPKAEESDSSEDEVRELWNLV